MEQVFFYIFAIVAVASAVCVITLRNPVHSAFFLIVCLMQIAAVFVLLRSPFLAAVQVFIYVGAVMVLFLFAVMVLDMGKEKLKDHLHGQSVLGIIAGVVLFLLVGYMIYAGSTYLQRPPIGDFAMMKNTEIIGRELYTKYIFPFEVVSLILLVALVGAIALVMRTRTEK